MLDDSDLAPFENMHVERATRIEHRDAIDGQALVLHIPGPDGVSYLRIMATAQGLDLAGLLT
jgi:hypothetical protein